MEQLLLITVVAVAGLTAIAGFVIGDRRRRADLGRSGPQPCRSIGDALSRAQLRHARVLLLFLGKESLEAREALALDPAVLELLDRPDLLHVVVGEDREIADTLFAKYGRGELPPEPAAVLLDREGLLIGTKSGAGLARWLPGWVGDQPTEGRGDPPKVANAEDDKSEG